jgi:hypothetical protein
VLAAIGLYGVVSYNVTGRTNEIGIRMSVGARPPDILKLVLGDILILIVIGVGPGASFHLAHQECCRLPALRNFGSRSADDLGCDIGPGRCHFSLRHEGLCPIRAAEPPADQSETLVLPAHSQREWPHLRGRRRPAPGFPDHWAVSRTETL